MTFSAILFIVFSSHAFDKAKLSGYAKTYSDEGKALMTMINSGTIDDAKARKHTDAMVEAAIGAGREYMSKDPKSAQLLKFVHGKVPEMKKMSFNDTNTKFHDGAALDVKTVGMNLKDEENEKYSDPVHIVVHPILTMQALQDKNLKAAKEELAEGLEQIEALVKDLSH